MNKLFTSAGTFKILGLLSVLFLILSGSGCNKDFSNVLPTSFKNDTLGRGAGKKVLYIVLDGVTGSALKALAPTNITQINTRATYSFDGLADDNLNVMTNAQAWTTMFTGVEYTKHNVTSEDFAGLNVAATPTLFTRIKDNVSGSRTVSIASTSLFNDKLATDATEKINAASDEAVKTAAINEVKTKNANLIVAQFHGAEAAGAANGYNANVPSYASAILSIDGYINEILTAMRTREGFAGENWLVVIASNKGGGASGGAPGSNIYGDVSRNTYVAFYNPRFSTVQIDKPDDNSYPFVGRAPRFLQTGTTEVFAKLSNTSVGNLGTGNYTLMFKIRNDAATDTSWPPFMGKKSDFTAVGTGGYLFSFAGTSFQFDFGNSSRPNITVIRDAKWHTIAVRVSGPSTAREVVTYSDGARRFSVTLNNPSVDNTIPFRIGTAIVAGKVTDFLLRDLAIFNIAMTDDEISSNMRKENSTSIIYPANLVGWWPCNDGSGFVLKDKSGKNNDFTLSSNGTWSTFNDLSPLVAGNITQEAYSAVPNGVDIPVLIYNWLNISVPSNWGLTGKLYIPTITLPTN